MTGRLLGILRRETSLLHETLDTGFSGGHFETMEAYSEFLLMQAAVLPGAEAYLVKEPEFATLDDWQNRMRTHALLKDIHALDLKEPPRVPFDIPDTLGSVAGVAYVLEGSRLGGRLIYSTLSKAGRHDFPVAFITHGLDRHYWRSFVRWLDEQTFSERFAEGAVASAQAVFRMFIASSKKVPASTGSNPGR